MFPLGLTIRVHCTTWPSLPPKMCEPVTGSSGHGGPGCAQAGGSCSSKSRVAQTPLLAADVANPGAPPTWEPRPSHSSRGHPQLRESPEPAGPGSLSRRQGVSRRPRGHQGPGTKCMGQSYPVSATSWSEPGPHPQHPGRRAASQPCSSCKGEWAGEPSRIPLRARPRVAATPASLCGTLGHSLSWVLTGATPVSPACRVAPASDVTPRTWAVPRVDVGEAFSSSSTHP